MEWKPNALGNWLNKASSGSFAVLIASLKLIALGESRLVLIVYSFNPLIKDPASLSSPFLVTNSSYKFPSLLKEFPLSTKFTIASNLRPYLEA